MDKKLVLTGTGKYLRVGSKGNRYKLVIDDIVISPHITHAMEKSLKDHKEDKKYPILNLQDFVRNKEVEVRLK